MIRGRSEYKGPSENFKVRHAAEQYLRNFRDNTGFGGHNQEEFRQTQQCGNFPYGPPVWLAS